jgi:hypothetical protein
MPLRATFAVLGRVHGRLGAAEKRLGVVGVRGPAGDAQAGAQVHTLAVQRQRRFKLVLPNQGLATASTQAVIWLRLAGVEADQLGPVGDRMDGFGAQRAHGAFGRDSATASTATIRA